jgi:hypothetical protein
MVLLFKLDADVEQIEIVGFGGFLIEIVLIVLYLLILLNDVQHVFVVLKGKKSFQLLQLECRIPLIQLNC